MPKEATPSRRRPRLREAPGFGVVSMIYTTDLSAVRALVERCALEAGLAETRAIDLVLAVSEVAANTVRHAKSSGKLDIWHDAEEIICQIQDKGTITDPLAGRRRPPADALGGHGLWLVHQVCDRVELRSDESGTTIRLHMRLPRP
jgi:anti-sigma regulatory factor (Ser/Thr protein kinase)